MLPDSCMIPVCGTCGLTEETLPGAPGCGALGIGTCVGPTDILDAALGIPNNGLDTGLDAGICIGNPSPLENTGAGDTAAG